MSGITVITPTGDRPKTLERCQHYIRRQTFEGDIQWVVADDGTQKANIDFEHIEYIENRPHQKRHDSFIQNFKSIIPKIRFDKIVIMEDDDWYHPEYLDVCNERLNDFHIIGEKPSRYYNIKRQDFRTAKKGDFCDLCMTAFTRNALKCFDASIKNIKLDSIFWKAYKGPKKAFGKKHVVGIKGTPGRVGMLTKNHTINKKPIKGYTVDSNWDKLYQWIGKEDTDFYKSLYAAA